MDDTLDAVFDADGLDDEADEVVDSVLDEIGVDISAMVSDGLITCDNPSFFTQVVCVQMAKAPTSKVAAEEDDVQADEIIRRMAELRSP